MDSTKGEGSICTCKGGVEGTEHQQLIDRTNASFVQDYNRSSERRQSAPTTETMRARVLSHRNGHN